jgi:hypothetical protein
VQLGLVDQQPSTGAAVTEAKWAMQLTEERRAGDRVR